MTPPLDPTATTIEYPIESLRLDAEAFKHLSEQFIVNLHSWPDTRSLDAAAERESGQDFEWGIPESDPLRTSSSKAYEGAGRDDGPVSVRAHIWCTLRGKLEYNPTLASPREAKRKKPNVIAMESGPKFEVQIVTEAGGVQAHWVFDVAGRKHPAGPVLHTDLKFDSVVRAHSGASGDTEVYDVPVPRMMSTVLYLGDSIDYALGELFPAQWQARLGERDVNSLPGWKNHLTRVSRVLGLYSTLSQQSGWQGVKQERDRIWGPNVFTNGLVK